MTKVVVVGAGPAGMAASWQSARSGAEVTLLDANPRAGGQIWRHTGASPVPPKIRVWLKRLEHPHINLRFGCSVIDIQDPILKVHSEAGGLEEVSFDQLILAPGAQELLIPFPGWTLPNVMGAGGALALVKGGMPVKGLRILVAGSGPLLFAVAGNLAKAGAKIIGIAEQATWWSLVKFGMGTTLLNPAKLWEGVGYARHYLPSPFFPGTWIMEAQGDSQVREITLTNGSRRRTFECDLVACGYGLVPSSSLAELAGCHQENNLTVADRFQRTSVENIFCAGEITGIGGVELAITEGEIAGLAASGSETRAGAYVTRLKKQRKFSRLLNRSFSLRDQLKNMPDENTIICRCEDITYGQLKRLEDQCSAKLYTRSGMGPCQGRMCANALKFLLGWELNKVRPPIFPARIGDLISKSIGNGSA